MDGGCKAASTGNPGLRAEKSFHCLPIDSLYKVAGKAGPQKSGAALDFRAAPSFFLMLFYRTFTVIVVLEVMLPAEAVTVTW
jgi:hypothetical protein